MGVGTCMGTFKEIQHDRFVRRAACCCFSNLIGYIANMKRHTGIVEAGTGERSKRTATPFGDSRMKLSHPHMAFRMNRIEHGTQGQSHTEAAYEDTRPASQIRARPNPELLLGTTRTAIHQHPTIETDQEIVDVSLPQFE
jgi:hypothetical protein